MTRTTFLGFLLFCPVLACAQGAPPANPQSSGPAQPSEPGGFVVEHVPVRRPAAEQAVEDRCVRRTGSHAAIARDERPTKGTQGTHGECAGQGFRGVNNDVGIDAPAAIH